MAKMNSKVRTPVDAASKITLRPQASAALVAAATVNEAAVSLDALTSYWDSGVLPSEMMEVAVFVNAANFAANETYAIVLEVANDSGFTAGVTEVARLGNVAGKTGGYVLMLDTATVVKLAPGAKFIRVKSIAAGTSPNLDYYAWMI